MPDHFIVLIGGPGLYASCDPAHDKSWKNYVVPMQIAAQKNLWKKQSGEIIHWFVYEPPYKNRWDDDSEITLSEWPAAKLYDTPLHNTRKAAADAITKKGALNYLHRIQQFAANQGIRYHGLKKKGDIWTEIAKLPDGSISRFWYSGHATDKHLFLSLSHDNSCTPIANSGDFIEQGDITAHSHLAKKFKSASATPSKFYGCQTRSFAEKWHQVFGVPTEGSTNKITFSVIGKGKRGLNVLERLETEQAGTAPVEWKTFP
ncbi:MAG: hypothetical protein OEZ39_15265 [Gammaproteobacteria bacterium]|nr:hypothetical protein [Gammaproteobacteria bacterium]MDH5653214.1 hypothetical protein [Gammaproteobacteria bacterium]